MAITARFEATDLGTGMSTVMKAVRDLHLPPSIRGEYGGTYQEQQKSFHDLILVLVLAILLVFIRSTVRVRRICRTAFAVGAGSQMLQPLAIAVIGGISISMVLSLIITPSIHYFLSPHSTLARKEELVPQLRVG